MESGEDPEDFLSKMDDLRLRLRDMGEEITDESYEDVILQALPKKYDFVRQTSHRDRSFGLQGIRSTVINMYIDELSRKSSSPSISGRGAAMAAVTGSVQCHHCKGLGYYQHDCPKKGKQKPRKKSGGGDKWCSYHRSKTHSDEECHAQAKLKNQTPPQANFAQVGSAHLPEDEDNSFGFSLSAIGRPTNATAFTTSTAATSTTPTPTGKCGIQLGPSQDELRERLNRNRNNSPSGLFGAFGGT